MISFRNVKKKSIPHIWEQLSFEKELRVAIVVWMLVLFVLSCVFLTIFPRVTAVAHECETKKRRKKKGSYCKYVQ